MTKHRPLHKKVLLIGWDSADWKVIHPLIDAGKMPHLEGLVSGGVTGNLATLYPDLSPMLWTSIATGKRPFKHGIHGFTEPDPQGQGIRPITSLSRKTKALWNILSQTGLKNIVVGWWPSHPAEPINGVMVSNLYTGGYAPIDKPWPMRPGTVHPERLVRNLAELRWHPQKLNAGHILPFVPRAGEVDQDKDHRLETIARLICDCSTVQAAALAIMRHEPWDFTAVYFDAIDHFSHAFMRYHPPRQEWVPEKDFAIYQHVVESGYIYHDIMLGKLLALAGDETTVLLISDHGFQSDHLRPRSIPQEPAGPAAQHRHYGIFVMRGPGIKMDEILFGAGLLDICPTILTLLGLPVGKDMDGRPLLNAFERPPAIETIESWDLVPGEAGMHPPERQIDPVEAGEAIHQLVELGYIDPPDPDREKAIAQTVRELHYNLARSYMDAGRNLDAISLLEELATNWPDEYRFGIQLASCYQAVERIADARRVLEQTLQQKQQNAADSLKTLQSFSETHKNTRPEDLTETQVREWRKLRSNASYNPYAVEYLMGSILLAEGKDEEALARFEKAETIDAAQPGLFLKLGDVYLRIRRWEDAERCFRKALHLDPDSAPAHLGLCSSFLPRRQNEAAIEAALDSVGLIYHNAQAHFLLGVALHRQGQIPEALLALRLAVSQNPNFPEAHRRLAYIYGRRLKSPSQSEEHRRLAKEAAHRIRELKRSRGIPVLPETPEYAQNSPVSPPGPISEEAEKAAPDGPVDLKKTVVIVSGLPRSGTSMVMQMLRAGGLPVLFDEKRTPDEDNPKGYFEYEPAKRFRQDRSWLPEARGKAVKLVVPFLPHLPAGFPYKILFVERNLAEVTASQKKMLERQAKEGARISDQRLREVFQKQMQAVKKILVLRGLKTFYLNYGETVANPVKTAAAINRFLGGSLDEAAMSGVVDAKLYRRRL